MGYINITNKLFAIVNANTDIADKFNYTVKWYTNYPTATVNVTDNVEAVLDSVSNSTIYAVTIRVVDRNVDETEMENRMRWICDDLSQSLRSMTLDSIIARLDMVVTWGWTDTDEPLRVFEIKCNCLQLNSI